MAQATLEEQPIVETPEYPSRMSWEEFVCWETEHKRWEWVDGEVIKIMSAEEQHDAILNMLNVLVTLYTLKHDLGRAFGPFLMRLINRPSGREPDLLFLRKENLHLLRRTFIDGPADLAIEVLSLESASRDRIVKLSEYERGGVREYWLLDHFTKETFFYQLDAQGKYQRVFADESGRYNSAALPGFWININWLWQSPKPLAEAMAQLQLL